VGGDVRAAREVLERAFVRTSESEQIGLAAVKLEAENGESDVARELLVRRLTVADTERVITTFLLSAILRLTLPVDLDEVGHIRTTARPV
jgi:hypothetical protein